MKTSSSDYTIRIADTLDAIDMLNIYRTFVLNTTVSLEYDVPSIGNFQKRVETVLDEAPWLVCEYRNKVVAYAYASKHRERIGYKFSRELSVYVAEIHRSKGIATALYATLIELITLQGYKSALIGIVLPNEKSVLFHEKLGFKQVGVYQGVGVKFGRLVNVGWWELPLQQDIFSEKIIPWKGLVNTHPWEETFRNGHSFLSS